MTVWRPPAAQTYIVAMTAVVVAVVALLVSVPGRIPGGDEELWVEFRLAGTPGSAPPTSFDGLRMPPADWRISATIHSSIGEHVHYEQIVAGRPVLGAWSQVHTLDAGERIIAGRMTRLRAPGEMPRSAGLDPVAKAREAVGLVALRAHATREEALLPTPRGLVPVTVVHLPARVPLGDWVVVVDEASLEVLRVEDRMSRHEGTGSVFERVPSLACGSGPGTPDAQLLPFVTEVELPHLTGTGYLDGRYVRTLNGGDPRVTSPSSVFHYPPSHAGFEQVMCYYVISRYFAHVESLGVKGYTGDALVADAHGYPGDNSFYSPSTRQLSFGDGGVPDAQDPEIILHELGHALHHRAHPTYPLSYASRALSEGIADYIACSFFDDPLLAEWDASAYSSECPPYLRRVDEFLRYPDDLTGSVHADGRLWSSALWSVRAALGAATTDRLLLESLFLLPAEAGPREAAAAFIQADAILFDGSNGTEAERIFRERGLMAGPLPQDATVPRIHARAFPNPFRKLCTIRYVLPRDGHVRIDITDVRGRRVRTLRDAHERSGSGGTTWDGRDATGRVVPEGVYFYRVESGALVATGKLVHLD